MRRLVAALILVSYAGCATTATPAATSRTMPEAVSFSELPPDTTREPIPPSEDWVVPVEDVEIARGDVRSGILLSDARAERAARLRIAYDELRALYLIDLRTWGRERGVYERYLTLADEEVAAWRARAQRSWYEEHGDEVGLFVGLFLGIVVTGAITIGLSEVIP